MGATEAGATFTFTMLQVGGDVVVDGSGTIDTAGVTPVSGFAAFPELRGSDGLLIDGPIAGSSAVEGFNYTTGPSLFGSGVGFLPTTTTGSAMGVSGIISEIFVPSGYVSGQALSDTMTFTGATLADLGVTPGTYVWSWGSGANADSLILQIEAPAAATTPEPVSLALLGAGLAGIGMARRRRRG